MKNYLFILLAFFAINSIQTKASQELNDEIIEHWLSCADRGSIEEMKELLNLYPSIVNAEDSNDWSALAVAVDESNMDLIKFLVKKRADVNQTDRHGDAILLIAAQKGHSEIIQSLLKAKAKVNHAVHNRRSALHIAAFEGNISAAKVLLNAKADPEITAHNEETPLDLALSKEHLSFVDKLFSNSDYFREHRAKEDIIARRIDGKGHSAALLALLESSKK